MMCRKILNKFKRNFYVYSKMQNFVWIVSIKIIDSRRPCIGLNLTRLRPAASCKSLILRLSRSRAIFARRRKQQITKRAKIGNPKMQDTIGITIDSGETGMKQKDRIGYYM